MAPHPFPRHGTPAAGQDPLTAEAPEAPGGGQAQGEELDARSDIFSRSPSSAGAAGAGAPRLIHSSGGKLIEFPAWTPDGRGIVFSLAEKSGDLFLMRRTASL